MLDQTLTRTDTISGTLPPNTLNDDHVELSPLDRATQLSSDMKRLMAGCEKAPLKAEVKAHIASLNDWADAYLQGLTAAQKLSDNAVDTLAEAQRELAASLDQYIRFEGEGGNPATTAQSQRTEDMSRILSHLSGLVGSLQETLTASPALATPEQMPPEPAPEVPPETAPEIEPQSPPETNPQIQPPIPPVMDPEM